MKAVGTARRLVQVGELNSLRSRASFPSACSRSVSAAFHERNITQCHTRHLSPWPYQCPSRAISKSSRNVVRGTASKCYSTAASSTPAMQDHQRAVVHIATTVKSFHDRGEKFRIFHGSTNSTRKSALGRDPKKVVDTSRLNNVLHIDTEKQTALVEPNVPMDRLVEATLEHGLIPLVVMEFPGITVGGGYSGTSGESSSFKHGFFDRTLNSVEMVMANGNIITCSETKHPDLFQGAAGALGTFGVTTLVEIQLRKAEKYVETTYHPVNSTAEAITKIQELADPRNEEVDYVDGVLFSPISGAIVTGRLTSSPSTTSNTNDLPIQRFSSPSDPWFYQHAQSRISQHADPSHPWRELIPLPEYLFRYDRGGFWVGRAAFTYFSPFVPFNPTTRAFLDDFLHTRMLYKALHGSGHTDRMFVQDLALPYRTAEEFISYCDERLGIWPLWLCPLKPSPGPSMHPHDTASTATAIAGQEGGGEQMLNIGLWGLGPENRQDFIAANRDVEATLKRLNGMRWLYAQTYHSKDEFWEDFDRDWYEDLRRKYSAEGLPTVYEKVKADEDAGTAKKQWFWPIPGFVGLRQAIQSREYIAARASKWKDWVPR